MSRLMRKASVNYSEVMDYLSDMDLDEYIVLQRFLVRLGFDQFDRLTFEWMSALDGYCKGMSPLDVLRLFRDKGRDARGGAFNPEATCFVFYDGVFTSYDSEAALDLMLTESDKFAYVLVGLKPSEVKELSNKLQSLGELLGEG